MGARFWVGGDGATSDIAHWSLTSGGPGGEPVPTPSDDVTFDAASNATSYTVTIDPGFTFATTTIGQPAVGTLTFSLAPANALPSSSNLAGLRGQFRVIADDKEAPFLWDDTEVNRLINLAYIEAVDRGLVIYDRDSFTIDTVVGLDEYPLDPSIIRIKQAWLVANVAGEDDQPLFTLTSDEVLDWTRWYRFGGDIMYQTVSFGTTRYGVTEDRQFIVAPKPTEVRTIRLEAWRHPMTELVADADVPEIPTIYHRKMLAWAAHLAFDNQDADTADAAKAKKFAEDFERDFGPLKNAQQRRAQLENRTLRVRPSPF